MRLQSKVVVITGAAHGIGKAYARRFAEEGAEVVIADIDSQGGKTVAQGLTDSGFAAWARATDVRNYLDVQALMRETADKFGRLDVLLNNAAIYVTEKLWKVRIRSRMKCSSVGKAVWISALSVASKDRRISSGPRYFWLVPKAISSPDSY
jgi:NAD(P)-dependent dehydrogenase (short-subunit alcohol dehydrogenase family)